MENKIYYGEYTLKHWIKLILNGNIILPEYQRHFVWRERDLNNHCPMVSLCNLLQLHCTMIVS